MVRSGLDQIPTYYPLEAEIKSGRTQKLTGYSACVVLKALWIYYVVFSYYMNDNDYLMSKDVVILLKVRGGNLSKLVCAFFVLKSGHPYFYFRLSKKVGEGAGPPGP